MSIEFEVKFNINSNKILKDILLDKEINKLGDFYCINMNACYYDTNDLDLLKHNFSLRVRKENNINIATLKKRKSKYEKEGIFCRNEWNVLLKNKNFGINLFEKKEIFLKNIIKNKNLKIIFNTKFIRNKIEFCFKKSKIELALDYGIIYSKKYKEKIRECEIELKYGKKNDVFKFIELYLKKFNLSLENKSKFSRGIYFYFKK